MGKKYAFKYLYLGLFVIAFAVIVLFNSNNAYAAHTCCAKKCTTCQGKGYTESRYVGNAGIYTSKFSGCRKCGCPGDGDITLEGTSSSFPKYSGNNAVLINAKIKKGCGHVERCSWSAYETKVYPTCTTAGKKTSHCTVSGCSYEKSIAIPATGHTASSTWSSDATNHYHTCTKCGAHLNTAAHTKGNYATSNGGYTRWHNCTTCGRNLNDYEQWITINSGTNTTNNKASQWVRQGTSFTVRTTANKGYHFGDANATTYKDTTITVSTYTTITTPSATANNYKVTLNANGGNFIDGVENIVTTKYDNSDGHNGVPIPERIGYAFLGYYDSNDKQVYDSTGNGVSGTGYWNSSDCYIYLGDAKLYAHWKENSYNVKYYTNYPTHQNPLWNKGNSYSEEKKYTYLQNVLLNNIHNYDTHGFYVKDWTISGGNYNGAVQEVGSSINKMHNDEDGSVIINANWARKQFTVTFDSNGGELIEGSIDPQTIDFESQYNLEAKCKKDNLIFIGWEIMDYSI